MRVFKFGGASLKDAARVKNVISIIEENQNEPMVIVVSAIGDTTNRLEKIVEHFYRHQRETAAQLLYSLQQKNTEIAKTLITDEQHPLFHDLKQLYSEMEWQLGEKAYKPFDFYYDQLLSRGELISSLIINACLQQDQIKSHWLDVRGILRTDHTYRDAKINWKASQAQMNEKVKPLLKKKALIVTQGFIASTPGGHTSTLGREGSDFSAALFANMLDAKDLTIWKDVEGLKNADPRLFNDTKDISQINFNEVIEMAYYGANVIHPKTIKPLQNKDIPLYVKSFLNTKHPGTAIRKEEGIQKLPPIIVLKRKQVLIKITTKDFSFISEENLSMLYNILSGINIKINLMQTGAINCSFCINQRADKIEELIKALHPHFKITYNEGLEILTVRHYKEGMVKKFTNGRLVLLEQRSPKTVQIVMR